MRRYTVAFVTKGDTRCKSYPFIAVDDEAARVNAKALQTIHKSALATAALFDDDGVCVEVLCVAE